MKIGIIGGGLAGLSTAFFLKKQNSKIDLTIIEANTLGGRYNSVYDNSKDSFVDNGQHLMIGAYQNFLKIIDEIGGNDLIEYQKSLKVDYKYLNGNKDSLDTKGMTGQIGLLIGILGLRSITLSSKLKSILFVTRYFLFSNHIKENSLLDLLRNTKQNDDIIKLLWEPITLATLNTTLEQASPNMLKQVMKLGFMAGGDSGKLIFAKVNQSKIVDVVANYLKTHHVDIKQNEPVQKVEIYGNEFNLVTKSGSYKFDKLVIATPQYIIKKILTEETFKMLSINEIQYSPIVSVYLWFDKLFVKETFFAMLDSKIQWVFNKNLILNSEESGQCLSITISAANELISKSNEQIKTIIFEEICRIYPEVNNSNLLNYKIFKEKFATILSSTDNIRKRQNNSTNIKNLYLAGCYTDTGLPSTIESAVLSGKLAAEEIATT